MIKIAEKVWWLCPKIRFKMPFSPQVIPLLRMRKGSRSGHQTSFTSLSRMPVLGQALKQLYVFKCLKPKIKIMWLKHWTVVIEPMTSAERVRLWLSGVSASHSAKAQVEYGSYVTSLYIRSLVVSCWLLKADDWLSGGRGRTCAYNRHLCRYGFSLYRLCPNSGSTSFHRQ